MGAVRNGDYVAKVCFAPVPAFADKVVQRDLDLGSAPEVYRPALVAELQDRPYELDIQVQLCTDLARMPVEDVTVEWPEALSPFVTVANSESRNKTSPATTTSKRWTRSPSLRGA
jgi:hypothetical protein